MASDTKSMRGTAMNFNRAKESLNREVRELSRNRALDTQQYVEMVNNTPIS